jgi:hypothetical protein
MRTTKAVRDRLERAAQDAGRSLAQEVEHRLEASFEREDWQTQVLGGAETAALVRMIGSAIAVIERTRGERWWESSNARDDVKQATAVIIDLLSGIGRPAEDGATTATQKVAQALAKISRPPIGKMVGELLAADAIQKYLESEVTGSSDT